MSDSSNTSVTDKEESIEIQDKTDLVKSEELAEKDRIIAEKDARYAEMMIRDGEPADKIERYTGLNIDVLKEIALSIGKRLVI